MPGSFSSELFLVEKEGKKMILKRGEKNELITELLFHQTLSQHKLPSLRSFTDKSLRKNEILLEYIEGSITLSDRFTPKNCRKWGEVLQKIHQIHYKECFYYKENAEKEVQTWSAYLEKKRKKAWKKCHEHKAYGLNKEELKKIELFIEPLLERNDDQYSLIHADIHSNNVLIKDAELVLFDKNPDIFSGDPLLDLAIAWVDMAEGSLTESENQEEVICLQSFIQGYQKDFREDICVKRYVMLIAFGRLYTPYSSNYLSIIRFLLSKQLYL